jgi:hypothetical protein
LPEFDGFSAWSSDGFFRQTKVSKRMPIVSVYINNADRKVGAMAKALAVEVAGFSAVKGTTKEYLAANGRYEFSFETAEKAAEFSDAVTEYLVDRASVQE